LSEKCITVDQVELAHKAICQRAFNLVRTKGAGYSGKHRKDTFNNIRSSVIRGLAKNEIASSLIRLDDKLARIINMGVENEENPINDEPFDDAVRDGINYILYTALFYHEQRGDLETWLSSLEHPHPPP